MTPAPKRRRKWLAIAGLAVLAVWGGLRWQAAVALQRRIESVGYYRVRAAYTVKGTGERIAFDYVAACATVVTMYRDGDRSVDTPFGIAPKTLVLPTRDGHAIQVVTPRACHHEVERGWIPPDLIPLTIWHDDVNKLAFGWGYTSQDAYDNARSRMNFEGASVTAATYADFLAWHAKAESEFAPVGQIRSPWGFSEQRGVTNPVSEHCDLYVRNTVFLAGQPALTAEWERRGRPEFWMYGDGGDRPDFWDTFKANGIVGGYVTPRTRSGGVGTIQEYSSVQADKARWNKDVVFPPNEVYPYLPISLASMPAPTLDSKVFPTRVPVSDDWKGLAACGLNDQRIDEVLRLGRFDRSFDSEDNGRFVKGRAGEPVGDRTSPFMVNDTVVRVTINPNLNPPRVFFQRDEYVFANGSNVIEGLMP